jgi:hypothetical protein
MKKLITSKRSGRKERNPIIRTKWRPAGRKTSTKSNEKVWAHKEAYARLEKAWNTESK